MRLRVDNPTNRRFASQIWGDAPRTGARATTLDYDEYDDNYDNYDDYDAYDNDLLMDDMVIFEEEMGVAVSSRIRSSSTNPAASDNDDDARQALRQDLRDYRLAQSAPLKKPAYTVLTNAALDGIANSLPTSPAELLQIKGIGPKKLELFGDDLLEIVATYTGQGLLQGDDHAEEASSHKPRKSLLPRPACIPVESLTAEQRRAADRALAMEDDNTTTTTSSTTHNNIFISGAAGTGKSHVLKYILQELQQRQHKGSVGTRFGVCAPTGVAAVNVGGSTLHSYFGIGLGLGSLSSLVKKVRKNTEATKRINETDILLVDEVSMVSSDLLETLDAVVREVRQDGQRMDEPFGGMRIVAVGDFFQLPPIVQSSGGSGGGDREQERPFCFDSYVWDELGLKQNTIELQQVQRQESGSKFELFLNMVRTGDVAEATIRDFNAKCLISPQHPLPTDGIMPTRLYTHNRDVDQENEVRLFALEGAMVTCQATDEWREAMPKGTLASVKKNMKTSVTAEMPDEVHLKVGAQVMLTRNLSLERGLVNGSRGVVERFDEDAHGNPTPVVRFDNGIVEKLAKAEAMRYNPDGGAGCLVRKQVPLRLAWAVTVHKSQGATLTRAILDISACFEPGQAYVSLSRVSSIDGLWLEKAVRMDNIMVSPRVVDYYRTIR
jgi:ATP-dependent DNA helicase PIF1